MTQPPTAADPGADALLRVALLGGVAAVVDGHDVDVGPAKCQLLLAALALSPRAAVPVGRLVELVWGDDRPRTAEKTLQSYATQLRKALGHDRVVRIGSAYRLDIDPDAVDTVRFERRLADGDTAGALDEWNGLPLAGLDPAGLAAPVAGLVERWLGAVESELGEAVDRDPAGTVGRLTELTAAHPFREGLWALLMTALYRSGRQAEALAAYGQARTRLVEDLGVEPGPQLRQLEARILEHDAELDRPEARRDRTSRAGDGASRGVPSGTVTFAFSEIDGASRLWAADRELTGRVIERHEAIVGEAADRVGGHVFTTGGDSFGVAFHRADDAARWATAVRAAVDDEPWPDGVELRVRIGLHTGDAEERDGNYFGPAVNLTARVAEAGHGGQILLTAVTAALVAANDLRVELRELGPVRLAGTSIDQAMLQLGQAVHPPLRMTGSRDRRLPKASGPLLGRADLLDVTVQALAVAPVVTLVGPGGIGKTRLSLAAAELASGELAAGAWLVELADVASSDDVARAVADALDVKEVRGRSLLDSIVATLASRGGLIVLDNCEHVVDGAAAVAEAISQASGGAEDADGGRPPVRVLATSREGLGVAGEQLVSVGPLDIDTAAVELFGRRALAADRSFDLDANRYTVAEICRRLDGVPLAIELAAARIRTLTPGDLVTRLDDSFRLLSGGRRRSVERHRTLRATIQWSHDLLTPGEQVLFRRLAVFAGSFDLVGAERTAADDVGAGSADGALTEWEIGPLLDDLVERSMVLVESGRSGRRFRLLETMRQFGAEQLAEHDDPDGLADRHAAYVAEEVARIAELLSGWREVDGSGRLADLWPNLRAAFDHAEGTGDLDLAARLIGPLAPQTVARRSVSELADWAQRILAMIEPGGDPHRDPDGEITARALMWSAFYYSMTSDREAYEKLEARYGSSDHLFARAARAAVSESATLPQVASEVVTELETRGEVYLADLFRIFRAGTLLGDGNLELAEPHLTALVDRFERQGPPTFLNWSLYMLAAAEDIKGDAEQAEHLYDRALAVEVPPETNSPNEVLLARALFKQGHHARAFLVLRDYAAELLEINNLSGATMVAIEFANLMVVYERLDLAGTIVGYLDVCGLLDVEGPAFRLLVADAIEAVEADAEAAERRSVAASHDISDRQALELLVDLLDELVEHARSI